MKNVSLRFRHVHLDFHTSEHCPNVGGKFNEDQFLKALDQGRVNSITVFALCHHGWCYYPTQTDMRHPNLKTDLLGRMLKAGKKAGINMPVYISVGWNDKASREHPEWRMRKPDGSYMGPPVSHPHTPRPRGWYRLCYNSPYLEKCVLTVTREVLKKYDPSGIFYDITGAFPCTCDWCKAGMKKEGLDENNSMDLELYAEKSYLNYLKKTTEVIWKHNPKTTVYHNGKTLKGRHDQYPYWSHYEIESLPTGGWGYNHFPINARYFTMLPKCDSLSHTGKFHRSWGEFGGFKNPIALKYEMAQITSLNVKCLVGDQLHPEGKMDEETYRIIGEAYREVEKREEWLEGGKHVAEVAILAPSAVMKNHSLAESEEGAGVMLMENHIPFVILDETMDFSPYKILILPDSVLIDSFLEKKLKTFIRKGGNLILSYESGLDPEKKRFVTDLGIRYEGKSPWDIEYLKAGNTLSDNLVSSPFLMYESGIKTRIFKGKKLADTWEPYFSRTYEHFCSHSCTPHSKPASWPAVVKHGNCIYFSHPIFRMYKRDGMQLHRDLFHNAFRQLDLDPLLTVKIPSCGRVSLNRQPQHGNRLILHVMYANPIRRGSTEVIEDVVPLYNIPIRIKTSQKPKSVYQAPDRNAIEFSWNNNHLEFILPKVELSQMVVIE